MDFFIYTGSQIILALQVLVPPTVFFITLAIFLKRKTLVDEVRRVLPETRLNAKIAVLDIVFVVPVISLTATFLEDVFLRAGLNIIGPETWDKFPAVVIVFVAILLGDIVGYWRHRLEHTALLWPSHAVHHSDTEMTWFSLLRFHPINRLTTFIFDVSVLLILGFPVYAVVANNLVRHYYGHLIHANLPWTYGRMGKVFVSPVMHRWHHAADPVAYATNYATVFAFIDRVFGTWRVPGLCNVALGVVEDMAPTLKGQMLYPFRPSAYRHLFRDGKRTREAHDSGKKG